MTRILNVAFLSIVALGILILATEPYIVNYERKHFGWVSLQSMAMAKNTRPENLFVGYTCEFEDGYKYYFSRYSVLFTVFTKYLLRPFESDSALHLYLSRQLMNIVYVATMGVMLLIAIRLLDSDARVPLVALLSGAGFTTLTYKNMYYFDPPALLAFLIFLYILVKHDPSQLNRRRGRFLLAVALLSTVGRSHVIAIGCLVWMILEALMGASRDNRKRIDWRRNLVLSVSALLVSSFTIAVNIAFNVSVEARLNDVGLLETGIVRSAERRLGLDTGHSISTMEIARQQLDAFSMNSIPGILRDTVLNHQQMRGLLRSLALLLPVCVLISVLIRLFSKQYDQCNREKVLLIMGIAGPVYVFTLRHWSYYHDFSAIYYLGSYLAFWIFVLGVLKMRKAVWQALLLLVALLFVMSVADIREQNATVTNPINYRDLDMQAQFLAGRDSPSVYMYGGYKDFISGSPYAMCYFLSPSRIAESPASADWTLAKEGEHYVLLQEN